MRVCGCVCVCVCACACVFVYMYIYANCRECNATEPASLHHVASALMAATPTATVGFSCFTRLLKHLFWPGKQGGAGQTTTRVASRRSSSVPRARPLISSVNSELQKEIAISKWEKKKAMFNLGWVYSGVSLLFDLCLPCLRYDKKEVYFTCDT